jgi:hypothetical protein
MTDPQDRAEALDEDKLGGAFPPDVPQAVDDAPDDAVRESFEDRDARHRPEDDRRREGGSPDLDDDPVTADEEVRELPEAAEEAALRLRGDRG